MCDFLRMTLHLLSTLPTVSSCNTSWASSHDEDRSWQRLVQICLEPSPWLDPNMLEQGSRSRPPQKTDSDGKWSVLRAPFQLSHAKYWVRCHISQNNNVWVGCQSNVFSEGHLYCSCPLNQVIIPAIQSKAEAHVIHGGRSQCIIDINDALQVSWSKMSKVRQRRVATTQWVNSIFFVGAQTRNTRGTIALVLGKCAALNSLDMFLYNNYTSTLHTASSYEASPNIQWTKELNKSMS